MNKVCEKVTGYTAAESLRMNVQKVIAPEFLGLVMEMFASRGNNKSASTCELEIIAKDGHRVTLEINTRLTFHHGKPIGVQGIARDVSGRRRAEKGVLRFQKLSRA